MKDVTHVEASGSHAVNLPAHISHSGMQHFTGQLLEILLLEKTHSRLIGFSCILSCLFNLKAVRDQIRKMVVGGPTAAEDKGARVDAVSDSDDEDDLIRQQLEVVQER